MATATTAEGKPRAAARREAAVAVPAPSRREFLYYIWGASMALFLGQAGAGFIWFALPRFKEGTFGGVFNYPLEKLPPEPGAAPATNPEGRFHMVRTGNDGIVVLYGVCTHLGCLPKWQDIEFRCPCHGSRYTLEGNWLGGPAPRGLDMFRTKVTFTDGSVAETPAADSLDGNAYAIPLNGKQIAKIEIDTGDRVKRPGHP